MLRLAVRQVEGKGKVKKMGMMTVLMFVGVLVGFGMVTRGRGCQMRLMGWLLLLICLLGLLSLVSSGHMAA